MTGTRRTLAGVEARQMQRLTLAPRGTPWQEVGGILALAAAAALWVVVMAGVAGPLGDALARIDAAAPGAAAPACPAPPGAVALAAGVTPTRSCP